MFEVGETYLIHWIEWGEESSSGFQVVAWEAPLLRVSQPSGETIFNTSASTFVKAIKRTAAPPYSLDDAIL